jgi:Ca-activated chloride channel homolog
MKKFTTILFCLLLITSGCSGEKEEKKEVTTSSQASSEKANAKSEKDSKKDENNSEESSESQSAIFKDLPKVPTNTIELVNQSPGPYADQEILVDEIEKDYLPLMKKVPVLKENATEEDYDKYFRYIYSLVSTDFADPQDLIKKWEFSMFGNENMEDPRLQFKENYNIEIILDSSGSMAKVAQGGKTQMELAKEAIKDFLANAPEEANVSLRVYGHKGTGSEADKEKSCSSIEQVYKLKPYNQEEFNKALDQFQPSGWTPVAGALESSKASFEGLDAKKNTNLIYLVSDGIETCDGNPVEVAKSFAGSNVSPIINVIGFNVDAEAQKQLQQVAESANGIYTTVSNGEQLKTEFQRAQEVLENWESWKNDALRDADAQRVDNSFDILGFSNDWNSKSLRQRLNISYSIDMLREEGKITFEQRDELRKRNYELEDLAEQSIDEIRDDLHDLNLKKIDDLRKQINDKYNTNTEQ